MKKKLVVGLFFVMFSHLSVNANISQTFLPSINSAGTRFVNGTWDYITTPYLYDLLKTNAISLLYLGPSNRLGSQGFNAGSRLDLILFPVYTALSMRYSTQDNISRTYSRPGIRGRQESGEQIRKKRINAILGLPLPYINVGLYVQISDNRVERPQTSTDNGVTVRIADPIVDRNTLNLYENKYGVEIGSAEASLSWAWTASIDYRDFTQKYDEPKDKAFNNAPLIGFFVNDRSGVTSSIRNFVTETISENLGSTEKGFSRREIGVNFLTWYSNHTYFPGNIGVNLVSYIIPTTRGSRSSSGEEGREVTLTGYSVQPTLFYDYDIRLGGSDSKSVLRLSPAFTFSSHSEKATIAASSDGEPTGGSEEYPATSFDIDITENQIDLSLGLKLVYFILPNFQLFVSYLPSFVLYHTRKEAVDIPEITPNENESSYDFFSNNLENFNLGLSFQPSSSFSLNMQIFTDFSTGEFYLTRFRMGLDFIFGTTKG